MIQIPRKSPSQFVRLAGLAGVFSTVGAVVLLRFPPEQYTFYPRCPIAAYLHFKCPGCGSTRALAALLHGQFAEALHRNALTTLLFPLALFYLGHHLWRQRRRPEFNFPPRPKHAIYTLLALTTIFTIVRNIHS